MATIEEVREFIRRASLDELKLLNGILTSRWKHIQAEMSMDFCPGDRVSFIKGKRDPRRLVGTVIQADGKWVYLVVEGHPVGARSWNWKVAPTLLRREERPR